MSAFEYLRTRSDIDNAQIGLIGVSQAGWIMPLAAVRAKDSGAAAYFSMFPPEQVPNREVGPEALDSKGFKWQWLRGLEENTYPGYDSHWRRTRSNYLGMLRLIDDQIKRLLSFLDGKALTENTVILYVSDHGDYFCEYGVMRKGVGMPEDLEIRDGCLLS